MDWVGFHYNVDLLCVSQAPSTSIISLNLLNNPVQSMQLLLPPES